VLVARVTDPAGRLRATLVNYACHPTTLAWDNSLISPDYVGAMREVVEAATTGPCVFAQGASGDVGPRYGFVGDTAGADRNRRQPVFRADCQAGARKSGRWPGKQRDRGAGCDRKAAAGLRAWLTLRAPQRCPRPARRGR